jgi:hypothetical protein
MTYLFELWMLVVVVVFGCAGVLIAGLYAWTQAVDYARARLVMQRIAAPARHEPFVISRTTSRNHDANSVHVA